MDCKWKKEKRELIIPEDEKDTNTPQLKNAEWFIDSFGEFLKSIGEKGKTKGKKEYVAPENLYDLNGADSFKSTSQKPG